MTSTVRSRTYISPSFPPYPKRQTPTYVLPFRCPFGHLPLPLPAPSARSPVVYNLFFARRETADCGCSSSGSSSTVREFDDASTIGRTELSRRRRCLYRRRRRRHRRRRRRRRRVFPNQRAQRRSPAPPLIKNNFSYLHHEHFLSRFT